MSLNRSTPNGESYRYPRQVCARGVPEAKCRAWAGNLLRSWTMLLLSALSVSGTTFPLQVSPNGRYLTDQIGSPFFLFMDSPWSLMVALTTNDVQAYLADRQSKGFNAVIVNLIEHQYGGDANTFGAPYNIYGNAPFANRFDFATTNEPYFAFCDFIVDECARRGFVLLLNPAYLSQPGSSEGWRNEVLTNGVSKCQSYGQFVGNRYKNKPNIIWTMVGDDVAGTCSN